MVSDVGRETLPHLVDIRCQLRSLQSKSKEILDHVRARPAAPVRPPGEPNLDVIRIEAHKVLWDSLGGILMSTKILLIIFMAAIVVLGVLGIQNRKEIRRLTERLEAVERVSKPAQR